MAAKGRAQKTRPRPQAASKRGPTSYSWLSRRLLVFVLLCAVLPLLLLGWGINIHYTKFAREQVIESLQNQIGHHRRTIELFLEGRRAQLQLMTSTHSMDYLADSENLAQVFKAINQNQRSITDLGVIAENGDHLAYVGPFNLMDKNYAETFWFKEVMRKGVHISDMFLGFRNEPHFIIAVLRVEQDRKWILRATIDTEFFRSLVESVWIGKTGEVYLLNQGGVFQTNPRFQGEIMGETALDMPPDHEGTRVTILPAYRDANGRKIPKKVFSHTWLDEPRWLLTVKQNYQEAFNAAYHAKWVTLFFIHLTTLAIIIVAVVISRHLIILVRARDKETEELSRQLMQTGKLAAIGELSAGVAHEINNPLAIILTERQLVLDGLEQGMDSDPAFPEHLRGSMEQIGTQVDRCQHITQSLLRFARRTVSRLERVDLNLFLQEIVELVGREAKSSGITVGLDADAELPRLLSDPSQLQQVFLNLINNAVDAHADKPFGTITLRTRDDRKNKRVHVTVEDTGAGIPRDKLSRIFDPFFTTKPVGTGTGLGLSICYSIIKNLGGKISVQSEVHRGTSFLIELPYETPPELQSKIGDHSE